MRVRLVVEYDGTDFCGWQIQPNGRTVQEELEKALKSLTGENVGVVGSGRTDSGVHALGQVAHFDVTSDAIPPERYATALNGLLPPDVKAISSEAVDCGFHARFSAKRKTYEYHLYESEFTRPLKDRYAARVIGKLDDRAMNSACGYLVGRHDFKCFLASNSQVKDTVREIYLAEVTRRDGEVVFSVCGNGFLYNMVRIIVGTLIKIGCGELAPESMRDVVESGDRKLSGKTMPPNGLILKSVEYEV